MKKSFVMKTMKRMAAIGTGAAMVGATLTGAMALDLADYPEPFVVDGVYDDINALVVGDEALAADSLGVGDIISNLQYESKTTVEGDSSTLTVTGGKTEQIPMSIGLTNGTLFDTTLEDDDIENLFDGTITFQSKEYDTSEQLAMTDATDPIMATSLTSSDDDYVTAVYLEVNSRDKIRFNYKFDEAINLSTASSADPLRVDFLGDSLRITSVDSAGAKFTAYVGEEAYLSVDESVEVEISGVTKTVTLTDVSSSSAVVDVDGTSKIISDGSTATVNGVEITVDDVFSRTERAESSANLIVGEQATETYADGDAYIGEDTDDPDWVWDLDGLYTSGTTQNLSIENDFVYNDQDAGAIAVGECISLPNDYVQICFDSLTIDEDDYASYTFEFDASADLSDTFGTNTSVPVIYISTDASEGLELLAYTNGEGFAANVTSTKRAKNVWLYLPKGATNLTGGGSGKHMGVFYKDTSDSKVKLFGTVNVSDNQEQVSHREVLRFNYGNTKDTNIALDVAEMDGAALNLTLQLDVIGDSTTSNLQEGYDDLFMLWGLDAANGTIDSLGDTRSTEEAAELQWSNKSGSWTNIGTKDEDHRTGYGIIIENPKSKGASDRIEFSVPQDQVLANIVIQGTSTSISGNGDSEQAVEVTPVTLLASEVGDAADYNLILVGGPCANELVEELFDMTCDGWSFDDGEAVVALADNGDNVALLVAGTSADDTRRAAKAVAAYDDYDFSGEEVVVSGTSFTDISVEAASESDDEEEAEEEVAEEEVAEEEVAEEETAEE